MHIQRGGHIQRGRHTEYVAAGKSADLVQVLVKLSQMTDIIESIKEDCIVLPDSVDVVLPSAKHNPDARLLIPTVLQHLCMHLRSSS